MRRFITRGSKQGKCNICGEFGTLTEDHTPPKGAVRITQMEMKHLIDMLSAEKPMRSGRISQNGVKFRTLCGQCNNSLLGRNYDLAFNEFTSRVKSYITSRIQLPRVMHVKAKPQKIARALYGHLSAVGVDRYFESERSLLMKKWFLDESLPMPDCLSIKYWIYPYQTQILIRDAGIRNLKVKDFASFWLMKFFPIAFFIIWDNPRGYEYPELGDLSRWRNITHDTEVDIPINLSRVPHEHWPEAPENDSFIVLGNGAVGAKEWTGRN